MPQESASGSELCTGGCFRPGFCQGDSGPQRDPHYPTFAATAFKNFFSPRLALRPALYGGAIRLLRLESYLPESALEIGSSLLVCVPAHPGFVPHGGHVGGEQDGLNSIGVLGGTHLRIGRKMLCMRVSYLLPNPLPPSSCRLGDPPLRPALPCIPTMRVTTD